MAYSRFANTWPGGGSSWYIYRNMDGLLCIMPPDPVESLLNERDVQHLRDILNEALADWQRLGTTSKEGLAGRIKEPPAQAGLMPGE